MKKSLFNKSAVALAVGLVAAVSAHAYVVGPALLGAPAATAGAVTASTYPAVNGTNAATQFAVNPAHTGHMLFVPYYSAQNGNRTYLTITNTDMRNGKAVKIRYRGASNSDDVKDFTLFLSPGDNWTGIVYAPSADAPARLTVGENDTSCTQPQIPVEGTDFATFRLHQKLTPSQLNNETREGYIEIFNMADIPPNVGVADGLGSTATIDTLYEDILHASGGKPGAATNVPSGCSSTRLTTLLNSTTIPYGAHTAGDTGAANTAFAATNTGTLGFEVPTTGLTANWAVVNPTTGRSYAGHAIAIEARTLDGQAGYGNIVFHPQSNSTTLVDAAMARARTADALLRGGVADNSGAVGAPGTALVTPLSIDLPDMSTPYLPSLLNTAAVRGVLAGGESTKRQAAYLTSVLATTTVSNEFLTGSSLIGTDWTFTMPTRRYNVVRSYVNAADTTTTNEKLGSTLYTNFTRTDADVAILAANDPGLAAVNAAKSPAMGVDPLNFFVGGASTNISSDTSSGRQHQLCVSGIKNSEGKKGKDASQAARFLTGETADRDESIVSSSGEAVFSPAPPVAGVVYCGEAGVLAFNTSTTRLSPTAVLSANVTDRTISTSGRSFGWMRFATPGSNGTQGLPVIGYSFMNVNGIGVSLPHRGTK